MRIIIPNLPIRKINKPKAGVKKLIFKPPTSIAGEMSFAKAINATIKVIFTTAYREYAVDGFNLQAVDYLLKPISFERLLQAVNKFLGENTSAVLQDKSNLIFVRSDRRMIRIDFLDINYIESFSDYIKINSSDKTITTRETITNIEAKLLQHDFMRIHRSFIVSLAKITLFTNEFIEINNKAIPISRSYKKEVLLRLESI